jgi:hypothetical protein
MMMSVIFKYETVLEMLGQYKTYIEKVAGKKV